MNLNSKSGTRYMYKDGDYFIVEDETKHYFVKSRGVHYKNSLKKRVLDLIISYNIDKINFYKNDLIIDVGANTGDLIPFFPNQRYIGFEPSPEEFKVLSKNSNSKNDLYNYAVGDAEKWTDFWISSLGADSSLYQPLRFESIIKVKQIRLDKLINERVKLLKVDAEGAEVEVINGCKNLLSKIEFIAIDLGFEKGIKQESTAPPVFEILYKHKFKSVHVGKNERYLFKNQTR